jgi:hypothetical protein
METFPEYDNNTFMTPWIVTTDQHMRGIREICPGQTRYLPTYSDSGGIAWDCVGKHGRRVTGVLPDNSVDYFVNTDIVLHRAPSTMFCVDVLTLGHVKVCSGWKIYKKRYSL